MTTDKDYNMWPMITLLIALMVCITAVALAIILA